jgi:hypothetical protein
MLREMADEVEVDQKFRQLVTNAAPAIVLSKENPLSNGLLSSGHLREFPRRLASKWHFAR